ncbi:MAG: hypothetical protein RMJ84_12700 [Sandaracinaceae bacterium]|nr:hypothetical protein [Sandaracinaceae bacterium]
MGNFVPILSAAFGQSHSSRLVALVMCAKAFEWSCLIGCALSQAQSPPQQPALASHSLSQSPEVGFLRLLPSDPCQRLTLGDLPELLRESSRAECLIRARLRHHQNRIDEGIVLLGFGVLSVATGSALLTTGLFSDFNPVIAAGSAMLAWGLINSLLSFGLLDLEGNKRRSIEAAQNLRGKALERIRDDARAAEERSASFLAFNAGLDLLYIATGILLAAFSNPHQLEGQWMLGYGVAQAIQGSVLLTYDLITWSLATSRASELRGMDLD